MANISANAAFMLKQAIYGRARKFKRMQHAFGREFIVSQVRLNLAPYLTEHGCSSRSARVAAQVSLVSKRCDKELGRRAYGAVRPLAVMQAMF